ncbi:hypothetical protein A8C56_02730 [Niabella ginsenosidivorans]|uniref:Peptidase S74 domain-containing protein n=1 Tax=Niabella ginsenosidivorans TaxID=1176587 RepID=A0A1A9HX99_9BACT|nr:hypothetical protein [Niabella ginsenosidivorans]ANH80038.1 hypothetical protein A8C56_02730 [Niabella ginsenosidivorans]
MRKATCFFTLFLGISLSGVNAQLPSAGTYVWNATDAPKVFSNQLQLSFVSSNEGFPSYGTVIAGGGYINSQDGSVFQLYIPYNEIYGGIAPMIRLGKYNNSGWSGWSTFYTSANANVSTANWTAKDLFAYGNVGIGTTSPQARLAVNGNILAKEIKIKTDISVPDYVFDPGYELPALSEVEAYIKKYRHLPEVPSGNDIRRQGLDLAAMNLLLLKKVEELTLHLIEMEKKMEQQKQINSELMEAVGILK